MYKELRNRLRAQGKRVHAEGVIGIGQELSSKEFFMDSKLNAEELDEVHHMPWVHGTYYDPWEKTACADEKLLEVVVDPSRSQQECIEEAKEHWSYRYRELESKGFYTTEVLTNHLPEADQETIELETLKRIIEEEEEEEEEEEDKEESVDTSQKKIFSGAYVRAAEKMLKSNEGALR